MEGDEEAEKEKTIPFHRDLPVKGVVGGVVEGFLQIFMVTLVPSLSHLLLSLAWLSLHCCTHTHTHTIVMMMMMTLMFMVNTVCIETV